MLNTETVTIFFHARCLVGSIISVDSVWDQVEAFQLNERYHMREHIWDSE